MKYIYAPWRDKYFSIKDKGCIFCKVAKSKRDANNFVLYRAKLNFVVLNIFPYTNAHVMIAPFRHCANFKKLNKEETLEMMEICKRIISIFDKVFKCKGYNIGINQGSISGAGFSKHIHLHIVGRWSGDTNFMTTIGDTRVVCSNPRKIYDNLKKFLRK